MAEEAATTPATSTIGVVRLQKTTGSPLERSIATTYSSISVASNRSANVTGEASCFPMAAANVRSSHSLRPRLSKTDVA